jgi:hypothetical protein
MYSNSILSRVADAGHALTIETASSGVLNELPVWLAW